MVQLQQRLRWRGYQEAVTGREGGRQAYSKTTSTSGIVYVKAYTLVCAEASGIRDKVLSNGGEFMLLAKGPLSCSISVHLMPNCVARVNSMDHM